MANHLLTKFVLVCLAVTTISSYRLDGQAAPKIRHARQYPKCPDDSPELLSSPWYGSPAPQERNKRSTRYHRDTEVHESKPADETPTSGVSQEVTSSSGGIDLSQVSFGENDREHSKNSNQKKQRRQASKYLGEVAGSQRILLSTPTGNDERMEGRTFVLRRVEKTTPATIVEDQPASSQTIKYFARFDRLLALYEELQKFREEYSKKTIYEYLESAIHHIFQTIVFDHLPSLLLARETAASGGKTSRYGKRNSEPSSMYDSEERNDKVESSRDQISGADSGPEVTMKSEARPADILEYSGEPRIIEGPESASRDEQSRDFESNFHLGTVRTSGNRRFGSHIDDDFQPRGTRQLSYEGLREDTENSRFPREPIERFASNFHYRFPAEASDDEKFVYRRMPPIAKRGAKREARDEELPANERDASGDLVNSGNSEKAEKPVDPLGYRESAIPEDYEKSARLARSAVVEIVPDDDSDAPKIEESEKSGNSGRLENSTIVGDSKNSENYNRPGNTGRTNGTEASEKNDNYRVSTELKESEKLENLNVPKKSGTNEKLIIPENRTRLGESERFFENLESLEDHIFDELERVGSPEKLTDEDIKMIVKLLEKLLIMERDAGAYTEVVPAHITVVEKPSTIVTNRTVTEKSPADRPSPTTSA